MPITDPLFYAIAIPVVLLSGISKTGIPGLFGGMAVPLLSLVIAPQRAAALRADCDAYHRHYEAPLGLHVRREYLLVRGTRR